MLKFNWNLKNNNNNNNNNFALSLVALIMLLNFSSLTIKLIAMLTKLMTLCCYDTEQAEIIAQSLVIMQSLFSII